MCSIIMSLIYENYVYKNLIEKYPTWDKLRLYLESEEGGLFKVSDIDKSNNMCIIRYEKDITNMTLPHSKWFRSVVWDIIENYPVCISPSKVNIDKFPYNTIKEMNDTKIICQELLDGFMINCFRRANDKKLYIVSRSKFNATGKGSSLKSFKEMFIESYCNTLNCKLCYDENIVNEDYNNIIVPNIENDEITVFYSFLVQHKEHRIVKKITENKVNLIHRGTVFKDGKIRIEDSPVEFMGQVNMKTIQIMLPSCIKISYANAVIDGVNKDTEVEQAIKDIISDNTWEFQGVVLKDMEGNRWRFRSEKYNAVRSLLGNSSNLCERYSQLYSQNLLDKYFEYFPESFESMVPYTIYMNTIVNTLYNYYVSLHITKIIKIEDIDKMWWPHLYSLHGVFLSQLRPINKKINVNEVHLYIHKLPWQRISFLLNKISKLMELISS